jgi:SAM-dependent methyltransferase
MPLPDAILDAVRDAILAEAARRAPPTLRALAALEPGAVEPPPGLVKTLLAHRAALAGWLDAVVPASPAEASAAATFARDPAGFLSDRVLRWVQARNQFLPLGPGAAAELRRLHEGALRAAAAALRAEGDASALGAALAAIGSAHVAELGAFVRGLGAEAAPEAGLPLRDVVSSEYAPELQLSVLGLDPERLQEPILDLGCGREARLVRALRARGKDATGVDRIAEPGDGVRREGWLDTALPPGSLGTVVSHLGFSLHFLHHHLRPGGEAARYARRYMDVLRALRPGGVFAYAPGLPFVEEHLPEERWRVERQPVPAVSPAPGTRGLPWYASRVIRVGE